MLPAVPGVLALSLDTCDLEMISRLGYRCNDRPSRSRVLESFIPGGQEKFLEDQDIALRHQLGFTRKPPKMGGVRRVLIAMNLKAFEDALSRWAETVLSRPTPAELSPPEAFAPDGKSARGSLDGLEKPVYLLALVAHESGLTLAQTAVPNGGGNKSNEHNTALRSLGGILPEGRLVRERSSR